MLGARRCCAAALGGEGSAGARNSPNPDAFVASGTAGLRVLIVDDTFTSGAKLQSAATALAEAGAEVVGTVPVGRVISTGNDRYPENAGLWKRQRGIRFDFDRCCLDP
jgi:hypothetical protein